MGVVAGRVASAVRRRARLIRREVAALRIVVLLVAVFRGWTS